MRFCEVLYCIVLYSILKQLYATNNLTYATIYSHLFRDYENSRYFFFKEFKIYYFMNLIFHTNEEKKTTFSQYLAKDDYMRPQMGEVVHFCPSNSVPLDFTFIYKIYPSVIYFRPALYAVQSLLSR